MVVVYLFVLFAIVLSVLLRFTDPGYPWVSLNSSYSKNKIVVLKINMAFVRMGILKNNVLHYKYVITVYVEHIVTNMVDVSYSRYVVTMYNLCLYVFIDKNTAIVV